MKHMILDQIKEPKLKKPPKAGQLSCCWDLKGGSFRRLDQNKMAFLLIFTV